MEEIDEALNNYIDEYSGKKHELILVNDNGQKYKVATYQQYKELQSKGYYPETNWDILYQFRFIENCTSLERIKRAKPSKISYLKDFDVTNYPLEYLPPTLDLINTSDEIAKAKGAVKLGKTWKEYDPTATYTVEDEYSIHIEDDRSNIYNGKDIYITQQAWGDFNDDGIEDVLLLVKYFIKEATYRSCEHTLLTMLKENGPIIHIYDW